MKIKWNLKKKLLSLMAKSLIPDNTIIIQNGFYTFNVNSQFLFYDTCNKYEILNNFMTISRWIIFVAKIKIIFKLIHNAQAKKYSKIRKSSTVKEMFYCSNIKT